MKDPARYEYTSTQLSRTYRLSIDLAEKGERFQKWAEEVIGGLERETHLVYSSHDRDAVVDVLDQSGAVLVDVRAQQPVSLRHWLPVGCQCIRWGSLAEATSFGADRYGVYKNNATTVLFPIEPIYDIAKLGGPAQFSAEIVLFDVLDNEDEFKFGVAHELVHSFDFLRWIVPAVQNWPQFSTDVLRCGEACESVARKLEDRRLYLDDYGSANELGEVKLYWPTHAERWFKATHGG